MRLEKVSGNPAAAAQRVRCLRMAQVGSTSPRDHYTSVGLWADLDGQAYVDYYCGPCRTAILNGDVPDAVEIGY